MEIVKTIPPKKTKSKKYMFVCKTCKKEENGFNYSKTTFIADYPDDFFSFQVVGLEITKLLRF